MAQLTAQTMRASCPCGATSTCLENRTKKTTAATASGHSACRSHRCSLFSESMPRSIAVVSIPGQPKCATPAHRQRRVAAVKYAMHSYDQCSDDALVDLADQLSRCSSW